MTSSYSNFTQCVEIAWRKARASAGGNCVEVGWHKATASGSNGHCVEAGLGDCGQVHVRDTKDRDGGELTFSQQEWLAFLEILKA